VARDLWYGAGYGGRVRTGVPCRRAAVARLFACVFFASACQNLRGNPPRDNETPLLFLIMKSRQHTALITGASSGIGYELAKLFARDKINLWLVSRDGAKVQQVADELSSHFSIVAEAMAVDLAIPEGPSAVFAKAQKAGIAVDYLVNNAGFGKFGKFEDVPWEESLGQVQLNITALTHLTKLFLAPMLERGSGRIMNVASTAAFQPGPLMAVYYATKAYVLSFSEALANEVSGTGVSVTCFCPGATDTNFQKRAQLEDSRLFKKVGPMDVKTVARDGYHGMMKGKTVVISGVRNWAVAESVRFAPRKMVTAISRWVQEKV
jgi:short-subunit dehydrogenase